MSDLLEVNLTLQQLDEQLHALVARGLSICGSEQLAPLKSLQAELARVGATYVATHLSNLIAAIESDDSSASKHMLNIQTVLRLFERFLTVSYAQGELSTYVMVQERLSDPEEEFDEDADEA